MTIFGVEILGSALILTIYMGNFFFNKNQLL